MLSAIVAVRASPKCDRSVLPVQPHSDLPRSFLDHNTTPPATIMTSSDDHSVTTTERTPNGDTPSPFGSAGVASQRPSLADRDNASGARFIVVMVGTGVYSSVRFIRKITATRLWNRYDLEVPPVFFLPSFWWRVSLMARYCRILLRACPGQVNPH